MAVSKKSARPAHEAPAKAEEEKSGTRFSGGKKKEFDPKNRGVLFTNDKEGVENRPDFTGNATIEVPEGAKPGDLVGFRVAAWQKESKKGDMYLSLSFSTPRPTIEE